MKCFQFFFYVTLKKCPKCGISASKAPKKQNHSIIGVLWVAKRQYTVLNDREIVSRQKTAPFETFRNGEPLAQYGLPPNFDAESPSGSANNPAAKALYFTGQPSRLQSYAVNSEIDDDLSHEINYLDWNSTEEYANICWYLWSTFFCCFFFGFNVLKPIHNIFEGKKPQQLQMPQHQISKRPTQKAPWKNICKAFYVHSN